MRISETEREIICAAHLDADQTVGDMARRTGYKEHTVRYAIEKLKRERILIPHPFINLSPLGYHQYTIFFSVTSESRLNIDALMRLMVNSQRVSWVGRLGGEYQYGISVCARSPGEVSEFLDETSNTFGPVFYDKTIAVIVSID